MKSVRNLLCALLVVAFAAISLADTDTTLAKENVELKQRVSNLEKELAELKAIVMQQVKDSAKPSIPAETAKPEPPATTELSDDQIDKIASVVREKQTKAKPPSNIEIKPYGFIKLDASYDTSDVAPGNYAKWVNSEAGNNNNDNQFDMTANSTRLGVNITSLEDSYIKSSGQVEVDFFGNGAAENKAEFMMRHAYAKLDWPEERFSILAGQTWDVISPLNPNTLNYSVQWWAGNIGYRRPQIRATKSFELNERLDLKLEGALTRNIGFSSATTFPNIGDDAGEDSGIPGIQGRVGMTFPLLNDQLTTVGISGHWAREEIDSSQTVGNGGDPKHFDSWSLNLDLNQPINKYLAIKGELFTGENLSSYLGGIGQGINTVRMREIGSRGGWVAASLNPWDKWNFNLGLSIDDPDNDDLTGMTGLRREYNRAIFGNMIYSINQSTQVGFELSQWHTNYQAQRDSDSIRAQTSLIYKF